MEFTAKQREAIDRLASQESDLKIGGYAGTGKTTLLTEVAKILPAATQTEDGFTPGVIFSAFTNKAVSVLRSKLPKGSCVKTIHSLTMKSREKKKTVERPQLNDDGQVIIGENGEPLMELVQLHDGFEFHPRDEALWQNYVIFDEASMLGSNLLAEIDEVVPNRAFVGDAFQLPPVKDRQLLTERSANILLDEIFRQAADSPIIGYAHAIRKRGSLVDPRDFGIPVLPRDYSVIDCSDPETIVICWRNAVRRAINRELFLRHFPDKIMGPGAKIMSYANDHGAGVFNSSFGVVATVHGVQEVTIHRKVGRLYDVTIDWDSGVQTRVVTTVAMLLYGVDFDERDPFRSRRLVKQACEFTGFGINEVTEKVRSIPQMEFGYAISCHKSQGSQFETVYVLDESKSIWGMEKGKGSSAKFAQEQAAKWLYTAVTRAVTNLKVMK